MYTIWKNKFQGITVKIFYIFHGILLGTIPMDLKALKIILKSIDI